MKKVLNIVVGLKDNQSCRELESKIQPIIKNGLGEDYELENVLVVYKKLDFDDCINAGIVNVGIMLEKFDEIAIGQGAIKNWKTINPNVNLILVMDNAKKASDKAHGLYKRDYYNGLFLGDFLSDVMMKTIMYGRTKEEAYEYYGMDEYYHNRDLKEQRLLKENIGNSKKEEDDGKENVPESVTATDNNINITSMEPDLNVSLQQDKKTDVVTQSEDRMLSDNSSIHQNNAGIKNHEDDVNTASGQEYIKKEEEAEVKREHLEVNPNLTQEELQKEKLQKENYGNTTTNKIGDVDILSLQNDSPKQEPVRDVVAKVNEGINGNISDAAKKASLNNDIVRTRTRKTDSLKNLIDAIDKLDKEDPYFKSIIDNAEALIAENENLKLGYKDNYSPKIKELYKELVNYFSYKLESELDKALTLVDNETALDSFEASVIDCIDMLNERYYHLEGDEVANEVFYLFNRFFQQYDILTDYIDEESISTIHVVDWNKIRVKRGLKRFSVKNSFPDENYYARFIQNIMIRNRKNMIKDGLTYFFTDRVVSDKFICNISITDGHISNTGRPEILIRKTRKENLPLAKLINDKLSTVDASLLITAVKNGENILFVGPSYCGATTLIRALLEYIPYEKSGVVLQHRDEIANVSHPELMIQHPAIVKSKLFDDELEEEDKIKLYSVLDITSSALQLDVDYYIMADVIGGEALSVYKAINKGYITWANIRANSAKGGLQNLANSIVASEPKLSRDSVCALLANKFGVVVYMERMKVLSISTIGAGGYDKQQQLFQLSEITSNNRKK